ncbi:MAG TPA: hypothetical protein PL077_02495 [Treponemataceae bacterium]|nr:hypothetical protein [Treponemataceae bacterium]
MNRFFKAVCIPASIAAFLTFASCDADPIFSAIEEEVAIADASVNGSVTSLFGFGDYLWLTDGYLRRKPAMSGSDGDWKSMDFPGSATRCQQIATDGTYIYAIFQKGTNWDFDSVRYSADGETWPVLDIGGLQASAIYSGANRVIFFTDSRSGAVDGYEIDVSTLAVTAITNATNLKQITGFAAVGTTVYFSTREQVYSLAAGDTAATPIAGSSVANAPSASIAGLAADGTNLYAVNAGYCFSWNGSAWGTFGHDTSDPTAFAYIASKQLLLIGGKSGYTEVDLSNGNASQTPGKATNSSIGTDDYSQYNGSIDSYRVGNFVVVEDPAYSPAGDAYTLYLTIVSPVTTRAGLWSYYPSTRSEWNRE